MTKRYHENISYHRCRLTTQRTHIMVSTGRETGVKADDQHLAQLFPAQPSPVINVSGLNSAPVGPERKRSHTPASRSICTLRGTYFAADPVSTSQKYVSAYTINSTTRKKKGLNQQPRKGKAKMRSGKNSAGKRRSMDGSLRARVAMGPCRSTSVMNQHTISYRNPQLGAQDDDAPHCCRVRARQGPC